MRSSNSDNALDNRVIFPAIRSLCSTKIIVVHKPKNEADFNETIAKTHKFFNQKVQMVILYGHGYGNGVQFWENFYFKENHWWESTSSHIKDKEEGGGLVILTCFAGGPNMLAEKLSPKVPVPISATGGSVTIENTIFLHNKALFFFEPFHDAQDLSPIMETTWLLSGENITPDPRGFGVISRYNEDFLEALRKGHLDYACFIDEQIEQEYCILFDGQPIFNGHFPFKQYNQYYRNKCLLRINLEAKLRKLSLDLARKQEEKNNASTPEIVEKLENEIQKMTTEMSKLSSRIEKLNMSVSGEKIFKRVKNVMLQIKYISQGFTLINSKERSFIERESEVIITFLSLVKKYLNILSNDNSFEKSNMIEFMQKKLGSLNRLFCTKDDCLCREIHSLKNKQKSLNENSQKEEVQKIQSRIVDEELAFNQVYEILKKIGQVTKTLDKISNGKT